MSAAKQMKLVTSSGGRVLLHLLALAQGGPGGGGTGRASFANCVFLNAKGSNDEY